MHGILKERFLTGEEKEKKENERRRKIAAYIQARDHIFAKIKKNIYDDEGLQVTWKVLEKNPDIYTFWNYRKKAVLALRDDLRGILEQPAVVESSAINGRYDKIKRLYQREFELTELCLGKNPKSYGAWHHRFWTVVQQTGFGAGAPSDRFDFGAELKRCDLLLSMDERNFHCWDYRRSICKLAETPLDAQLKYCEDKIKTNFSNYSAWHYRSTLLPKLFPDEKYFLNVSALENELKMSLNAMFTDPDDQSSFLYRNRLLKRIFDERRKPLKLTKVVLDECQKNLTVYFNENVSLKANSLKFICNEIEIDDLLWTASDKSNSFLMWNSTDARFNYLSTSIDFIVEFEDDQEFHLSLNHSVTGGKEWILNDSEIPAVKDNLDRIPERLKNCLKEDLKNLEQLCAMEADKKWPLLSLLFTMKYLDLKEYLQKIKGGIERLKVMDSMRTGYYDDLMIKWNLQEVIS